MYWYPFTIYENMLKTLVYIDVYIGRMWCFQHVKEKSCDSYSEAQRSTLSSVLNKYGRLAQEVYKTLTFDPCDVAYGLVWSWMLSCSLQPTVTHLKTWKLSLVPQCWTRTDVKPTYMAGVSAADVHSFPIESLKPAVAKEEGRTLCIQFQNKTQIDLHWPDTVSDGFRAH